MHTSFILMSTQNSQFKNVDENIFEEEIYYALADGIIFDMPESVEESIDRIDNSVDESESNEPKESEGPNIRKNFPETFIWETIEYV